MPDCTRHAFLTTALDPALLSTPFHIQTAWHVITGAPCCGKTTLIDQLANLGYRTRPEVGREYIELEVAKGRTLGEIRSSEVDFCYRIRDLSLEIEAGLLAHEPIFLDRGFPDCITFYRIRGLDPNAVLLDCFRRRYASVFVLDRFPLQRDNARTEDDADSDFLDEWLARDYGALGYQVIRVPVMPREERLAFVLARLAERGPL